MRLAIFIAGIGVGVACTLVYAMLVAAGSS